MYRTLINLFSNAWCIVANLMQSKWFDNHLSLFSLLFVIWIPNPKRHIHRIVRLSSGLLLDFCPMMTLKRVHSYFILALLVFVSISRYHHPVFSLISSLKLYSREPRTSFFTDNIIDRILYPRKMTASVIVR